MKIFLINFSYFHQIFIIFRYFFVIKNTMSRWRQHFDFHFCISFSWNMKGVRDKLTPPPLPPEKITFKKPNLTRIKKDIIKVYIKFKKVQETVGRWCFTKNLSWNYETEIMNINLAGGVCVCRGGGGGGGRVKTQIKWKWQFSVFPFHRIITKIQSMQP